jgi:methyltransferase
MILGPVVLAMVTIERLGELALSRRNASRLLQQGGRETGQGQYWPMVGLHAAWLAGLWLFAFDRAPDLGWLAVYAVLQVARVWVLATLGPRWTTRIIVQPGAPLATGGPYRWLRHPNYAVVVAEIAVLPLAFGLVWFAFLFSLLNALFLAVRIRAERAALAATSQPQASRHGARI